MNSLNDSLYLLAGAFDLFPDAILVVDVSGTIRNTNKQVETVLGYRPDEVIGQNLNMLLPERYRHGHHNFVASFFERGSIRKMGAGIALYGRKKDGHEINIDIALSQIVTSTETFALAVVRDISDKISLASRLGSIEKMKSELEQFAYVLTHDLKAPLQKVKSLAQLIHLELSEQESDDIKTMIGYLTDSVSGMESLIYGVLDYHKAKLLRQNKYEQVDLNDTLNTCLEMLEIPERFQIQSETLPVIFANKTAILQVFLNLVGNSIKHCNKIDGFVKIESRMLEGSYLLSFSDNGSVVPQHLRPDLFNITAQMRNAATSKSHGFGLSIVREIIELNEGHKIWYEENEMGGSSFLFTWPALVN